ncbi:MAG: ABC transporter permease, partial [Clostridiaceae bacterium]|nr:ABC transporter permease [Clostridiaceae bacterium]
MSQEKQTLDFAPNELSEKERKKLEKKRAKQEKYYTSSQWQLMGRKLIRHKLAVISFILLAILYTGAIFAGFLAPQGLEDYSATYSNAPPSKIRFVHNGEFIGPFVYDYDIA